MTFSLKFQEYLNKLKTVSQAPTLPPVENKIPNALLKSGVATAETLADSQAYAVQAEIDEISSTSETTETYTKRLDEVASKYKLAQILSPKVTNVLNTGYSDAHRRTTSTIEKVKSHGENLSLSTIQNLRQKFLDYPSYETFVKQAVSDLKSKQSTSMLYDSYIKDILDESRIWFSKAPLGGTEYINKLAASVTDKTVEEYFKIPDNNYSPQSILTLASTLNKSLESFPEEVRTKQVKAALTNILSNVELSSTSKVMPELAPLFTQDEIKSIYSKSEKATKIGQQVSQYKSDTSEYAIQRANATGIGLPNIVTGDIDLKNQNNYLLENDWTRSSPEEIRDIPEEQLPNKLKSTRQDIIENFIKDFDTDFVTATKSRGISLSEEIIPLNTPIYDKQSGTLIVDPSMYDGIRKRMQAFDYVKNTVYNGSIYVANPFTQDELRQFIFALDQATPVQRFQTLTNIQDTLNNYQKDHIPTPERRIDTVTLMNKFTTDSTTSPFTMLHDTEAQESITNYISFSSAVRTNSTEVATLIGKHAKQITLNSGDISGFSDGFLNNLAVISATKNNMSHGIPAPIEAKASAATPFEYLKNGSLTPAILYSGKDKVSLKNKLSQQKIKNPFDDTVLKSNTGFFPQLFGVSLPDTIEKGTELTLEQLLAIYPDNVMVLNAGNSLTKFRVKIAPTVNDAVAGNFYPINNYLIDIAQ